MPAPRSARHGGGAAGTVETPTIFMAVALELTDFKRDLSELTERLGQAQDCL